jgi:hypothetical protein
MSYSFHLLQVDLAMVQDFIDSYAVRRALNPLLALSSTKKLFRNSSIFLCIQDVDGDGKLAYDELDLCLLG